MQSWLDRSDDPCPPLILSVSRHSAHVIMPTTPRFIRPNYFDGRLLTAADYQAEQDYHRRKCLLQNRILFGISVVTGLRVSISKDQLTVSPGLAYDCQGNELLLEEVHHETIVDYASLQFVTIEYREKSLEMTPMLDRLDSMEEAKARAAYTLETVDVSVTRSLTHHKNKDMLARAFGCDSPHPVCLARISWRGRGWSVLPMARRVNIRR